jgi:hypothetical protein
VAVVYKQTNCIRIEGNTVFRKGTFLGNTDNKVLLSTLYLEPLFLGHKLP